MLVASFGQKSGTLLRSRCVLGLGLCLVLWMPARAMAKELPDFTEIVEQVGPAVVNISIVQKAKPASRNNFQESPFQEVDPFFELFRRLMPLKGSQAAKGYQAKSLGSGFIVSSDGYVLTSAHVVEEAADDVIVKLADKREFKGKVMGVDKRTDVALLKIEATKLPIVGLGDPAKLKVGEWVLAMGALYGLDNTVTAGVLSAKARALDDGLSPFIQTDAAVNLGNAGGPLLNLRGEVVGINAMVFSQSGGYQGLSFATPIDVALEVMNQLKSGGKVTRSKLGVGIQDVSKDIADSLGLPAASGALIGQVDKGNAAEKAGIKVGDVVLKVDNKPVQNAAELSRLMGGLRPGAKVTLQVWRAKSAREIGVILGASDDMVAADKTKLASNKPDSLARLGIAVVEADPDVYRQLDVSFAVMVTSVQGAAGRAGLAEGDWVVGVNNDALKSLAQFKELIDKVPKNGVVALLIKREDSALFIPVRLDK